MPEYTYTDGDIEITVIHPVDLELTIITGAGVQMWRMPSKIIGVNWVVPPHLEASPQIYDHIKTADRRRQEYKERNEHD